MNDFYELEIERLHQALYVLYRGGSTDVDKINGLWARIERLQLTKNKVEVKEAKAGTFQSRGGNR